MAIPVLSGLWQLARRVEGLFENVENLMRGLQGLRDELRELDKRVSSLENREELLVEKARSAAAVAASNAVTHELVEMSRRIGVLEAGQGGPRRIEGSFCATACSVARAKHAERATPMWPKARPTVPHRTRRRNALNRPLSSLPGRHSITLAPMGISRRGTSGARGEPIAVGSALRNGFHHVAS